MKYTIIIDTEENSVTVGAIKPNVFKTGMETDEELRERSEKIKDWKENLVDEKVMDKLFEIGRQFFDD